MSENTNESRLPPPAFPPGQRRHVQRNSSSPPEQATEAVGDDAFISPDDPIPQRRDPVEEAFISPDEPIPERKIKRTAEFAQLAAPSMADGDGEVVGMDLSSHTEPEELGAAGDPDVIELVGSIARLSESLKRRGEAGLRTLPEMSRFDTTLRAYCVGYLAGRRAESPRPPLDME